VRVLVTGGTGFVGSAVVRLLAARGDGVRVLARGETRADLPAGVEVVRADIADPSAVRAAAEGCDAVVHTAAKAGVGGPAHEYVRANVDGTRAVITACRGAGIRRLVHTSSPSVVFRGEDMEGVDESAPYPPAYDAAYPETKAEAERIVLASNGPGLATVALRPHLVWGPGDNHLVPRLVARARAGRLRRIGARPVRIDATYVDNAADAHVAALDRLAPGAPCAGRSYFIANGEPVETWTLVAGILAAAGAPPVTRSVPAWLAVAVGAAAEAAWAILPLRGEPPMTRFVARELATSHWFDLSAARRDLGWEPRVSTEEGLRRLAAWFAGGGGR
jgi:nucleoside-diphosphate-sugar epimerase